MKKDKNLPQNKAAAPKHLRPKKAAKSAEKSVQDNQQEVDEAESGGEVSVSDNAETAAPAKHEAAAAAKHEKATAAPGTDKQTNGSADAAAKHKETVPAKHEEAVSAKHEATAPAKHETTVPAKHEKVAAAPENDVQNSGSADTAESADTETKLHVEDDEDIDKNAVLADEKNKSAAEQPAATAEKGKPANEKNADIAKNTQNTVKKPKRNISEKAKDAENSADTAEKASFSDAHPKLHFFLQHLGWGARMILAVVAVCPILLFMVWFNYTVDCSGLFHGDVYTREIASMLLSGQNVDGYESMDERSLTKLTIEQMEKVPATVALGSSRVMQMTREVAGTDDFYNFGVTGGDFYDMLGTFELFEEKESLPENVILCVDPWLLNGTGSGDTVRSDRNLYNTFLSQRLDESAEYTVTDENALWKALVSPSYFQGNWKYWLHDRKTQEMPKAVSGEAYDNSATEIKNSDGSIHYTVDMLNQTPDQTAQYALDMAGTYAWCDGFVEPDAERVRLLKEYISYMQGKGIHVYILLTPMHPIMYEYALTYPADDIGFLRSEDAIRQIAAETNVPVYGSYNPHILSGVDANSDFFDGVHCTSDCLTKFWPGIETARSNESAGIDPADSLLNTVDNNIYAELLLRCGPETADEMRALLPLNVTDNPVAEDSAA